MTIESMTFSKSILSTEASWHTVNTIIQKLLLCGGRDEYTERRGFIGQ